MLIRCRAAAGLFLFCVAMGLRAQVLTEPVGKASAPQTATVTMMTGGTLSAINVLTLGTPNLDFNLVSGGTCMVGMLYSANATCSVLYTFTPMHPGLRYGGISLSTSGSVVLGNAYIYGLGTGPQVIYSPASQSLLGGTYSYPTGVAVDAAGDVFLTDENANAVYEIPAGGGASFLLGTFALPDDVAVDGSGNVFVIYNRTTLAEIEAVNGKVSASSAVNVIASNFSGLDGMKVDGNGNVYLAEGATGGVGMIQEVLAVNGSIPSNPTVLTLVSNVGEPTGVAVDAASDVFISDQNGNAFEALAVGGVIPATPTIVTLASGLNTPTNIALDAAGNVFVSLQGGIAEIVALNGVIPANPTVLNLGTNIVFAQGLAVDASGNVFIADDGTPYAVKLDFADAPSLTFATTQVGSTSTDSPQTVSLINDGNANLSWTGPIVGTNPTITTGYTFTSTCPTLAAGTTVAYAVLPGGSCAESISFKPVTTGPDAGKFTLMDNDLNVVGAQQNILLNAIGTIGTTAISITPNANPAYALQPIILTVHLTVGGQPDASQSVSITYNPTGTAPIVVPLTTDATGTATYTIAGGLNPGSYVIGASFAGTSSQQASSFSYTEVVVPIPTTSTLTIAPNPPFTNSNVVLTATVAAQVNGPPPGMVTFTNGAAVLGTVTLNTGVAQLAIGTLTAGNYTFSCTYNGATDYATSTCAPITFTVVPPSDFSLTANPPSITIETQHHKTMQLTLASIGPFAGPVTLGCQGPLPPYLTCELPASETLSVGQTLNFNFTMDTDAVLDFLAVNSREATPAQTHAVSKIVFALLLPLALAGFARRRKMLRRVLLLIVLAVGATALMACGDKWPAHTPPGTYTITVVGTGITSKGLTSHTLPITLTVTP